MNDSSKDAQFPQLIDYQKLKEQYGDEFRSKNSGSSDLSNSNNSELIFNHQRNSNTSNDSNNDNFENKEKSDQKNKRPGLTGTRLRSYAFAVLTRKEYSKKDLIEKLALYAENREEVLILVDELSRENYQSDQRVAEMVVRSQIRKGKGPNRIKLALRAKSIDKELAQNDMNEIDWYDEAYQLKVKKYGVDVSKDTKIKAKQIRFLQYRGFEMDAIMKAISRKNRDDE